PSFSVRSIMSCLMLSGSDLLPVTLSIRTAISRTPKRLRLSAVNVRSPDPGWLELRSVRDNQQHAKCSLPFHCPPERFEAGRVNPMHVLEDREDRIGTR